MKNMRLLLALLLVSGTMSLSASTPDIPADADDKLRDCLLTAQRNYDQCVKDSASLIPYWGAYQKGLCTAKLATDRADCINADQARNGDSSSTGPIVHRMIASTD